MHRLNLCSEVVDGLRSNFDHIMELNLPYTLWKEQHDRLLWSGCRSPPMMHVQLTHICTDEPLSQIEGACAGRSVA